MGPAYQTADLYTWPRDIQEDEGEEDLSSSYSSDFRDDDDDDDDELESLSTSAEGRTCWRRGCRQRIRATAAAASAAAAAAAAATAASRPLSRSSSSRAMGGDAAAAVSHRRGHLAAADVKLVAAGAHRVGDGARGLVTAARPPSREMHRSRSAAAEHSQTAPRAAGAECERFARADPTGTAAPSSSSSSSSSPLSSRASSSSSSPSACDGEPFSLLPDELLVAIFSAISPAARPALSLVCRRWWRLETRLRQRLRLDSLTCAWDGTADDELWGPHRGFMDATLERILPRMTGLQHVEVVNVGNPEEMSLTDDGLMLIGTWCRQLQTLHVRVSSAGLSGRGIAAVLLGCGRTLCELSLHKCPGVGRQALKAVADYCPQLTSLSLRGCPLVDDDALASLTTPPAGRSGHSPALQRVDLDGCRNVRDKGVEAVTRAFAGSLKRLDISRCDVTDVGVLFLSSCCQGLTHFVARGCSDLSNASMKGIAAGCPQLEELDVRRTRWITPAGVHAVLKGCRAALRRLCVDAAMASQEVRGLARAQGVELLVAASSHRHCTPLLSWS